jgi:hypothetical protein
MRQYTFPNDGDQMDANAEAWILFGKANGLLKCRAGNHQTATGQNTLVVGANNSFVNFFRSAEIIGVNNHLLSLHHHPVANLFFIKNRNFIGDSEGKTRQKPNTPLQLISD